MNFSQTVAHAYRLGKEIKALEEERENLLGSLGDLSERNYPAGDFILQVTRTKRFDEATAKRNLTSDEFTRILKLKPDSTLAKAILGDEYARTQREYGWTKKIVRVEDAE